MAGNSDIVLHRTSLGSDLNKQRILEVGNKAENSKVTADLALSEIEDIEIQLHTLNQLIDQKESTITLGTAEQYFKGNKTWSNFAFDVLNIVLTGLSLTTGTAVVNTDTLIVGIGKLQKQINNLITAIELKAEKSYVDTELAKKESTITAGTSSQFYRGDKTWASFASGVLSSILTGINFTTNAAVIATDTVLIAVGKLQAQLNNVNTLINNAIVDERTTVATLTNKTINGAIIRNFTEFFFSNNITGNYTVDLNNGTLQKLTLTGNCTITLPASISGKNFTLMILYSGAFVPTFVGGTNLIWSERTTPPAKSIAGYLDIFVFTQDGTSTYGRSGGSGF